MSASAEDVRTGPGGRSSGRLSGAPTGAVVAALAGLVGGWIATGSIGLLAHPLRHGLIWIALGLTVVGGCPGREKKTLAQILTLLAGAAIAFAMVVPSLQSVNVLAVPVLLATLARRQSRPASWTMLLAAEAVTVLAVFHLARTSIPLVWLFADTLGGTIGWIAGTLVGERIWYGATFAGVDFLVTMVYLATRASWISEGKRPRRILLSVLAVVVGHLIYLIGLIFLIDMATLAPESAAAPPEEQTLRRLVPWNATALAAVIHLLIAAALFSWYAGAGIQRSAWRAEAVSRRRTGWVMAASLFLAVLCPVVTSLHSQKLDLTGKKIVIYEKGFLNWLKPKHGDYGRLSQGMYGMLPTYIESLGARSLISSDLSEEDLADADALILLFPNEPWADGQLERIWNFVRAGGALLLMGEHTVEEEEGGSRINDVLQPTDMRVRFDSTMFAVGGWLHSYEALSHPASAGISDEENHFGAVIGASVAARWPAGPLLVGRWGWNDPGDVTKGESKMGNGFYDAGEKLGDSILAAEQRVGKGKVIVFGDTSGLTNGLTIGCHVYTSRLLAYVADRSSGSLGTWRQWAGIVVSLTLLTLLIWQPVEWQLAAVAVVMATSLVICTEVTHEAAEILPVGDADSPTPLAYIDVSHSGAFSRESWREDGVMGLALTLVRNGYLALTLPEITPERLSRCRLLVLVAPAWEFSEAERQAIKDFVQAGGILICTVGYEQSSPSRQLLSELGFRVLPQPLGFFKAPFFDGGDYYAYVRFHAAWPVQCDDPNALNVAYSGSDWPVIVVRRIGLGLVAVIGDTCFAMNKNLENEEGAAFEGMYENAIFWRWFLALLGEGEQWHPPNPETSAPADKAQQPAVGTDTEEAPE